MTVEAELEQIINDIIDDARGKWSSHQQERSGVMDYIFKLNKIIEREISESDYLNQSSKS